MLVEQYPYRSNIKAFHTHEVIAPRLRKSVRQITNLQFHFKMAKMSQAE
jgi:hypothetical protein